MNNIRTICTEKSPCYLLLVEDDSLIIEMVRELLPLRTGIQVIPAFSYLQAISILHSLTVEVILLDLNLPDCGGIDTLKRLSEAVKGRIPIIILTGSHDLEDECFANGARDFLTKPLHNFDLVGRIKNTILWQKDRNALLDHCHTLEAEIAAIKCVEDRETGSEAVQDLRNVKQRLMSHVAAIKGNN